MANPVPPKQPVAVPPHLNKEDEEEAKMLADMAKRRAEEAAIAKVQDAALEAVRIACDKERKLVSNPKVEASR
jgi:hypothetical protein